MKLLVSVRSAAEAETALAGGAHFIDIKEPLRGALGRADDAVITAIVRSVGGRVPVSAALGELADRPRLYAGSGLNYVKWGLAGLGNGFDWRQRLETVARTAKTLVVATAYADWQRATAPPPDAVLSFVSERGWPAILLDTWGKDGSTLLDWMKTEEVEEFCARCRAAEVRVALAGSLGPGQLPMLFSARPDWFAIRGAACVDGRRGGVIDAGAVRKLVDLLGSPAHPVHPPLLPCRGGSGKGANSVLSTDTELR